MTDNISSDLYQRFETVPKHLDGAGSKDTFVVRRYVEVFDVTLVVESVVEVDMTVRPASVASQHPTLTHGVQDTTVC